MRFKKLTMLISNYLVPTEIWNILL